MPRSEATIKNGYTLHGTATAPAEAAPLLAQAEQDLGEVPNLERVIAGALSLLRAYVETWAISDRTTLTPAERQMVCQAANVANGCSHRQPWHACLSKRAGMRRDEALRLRDGLPLSDPRLEALRVFAAGVLDTKGEVGETEFAASVVAGFTRAKALKVVVGLAIKVMSNYTNALAGTPLDTELASWERPAHAGRGVLSRCSTSAHAAGAHARAAITSPASAIQPKR